MKKIILALDQGTTSSRAILFDGRQMLAMGQQEFPQHYPHPGWVEHDPEEIWQSQLYAARTALAESGLSAGDIAAISITNQRETTLLWERATGRPVCPAIVWQCRRTADFCRSLREQGLTDLIREKTGLVPDPYFSATKLVWLLNHTPGLLKRAQAGELCFGTVDSWLIWKLSGGKLHVTDYTNASRTMLMNIHTLDWDDDLLERFGIPRAILPRLVSSREIVGETDPDLFGTAIPIAGIAGDQQAALFGQGCTLPGQAKNTYGTGCFLLMNMGQRPVFSAGGLLTTVACAPDGSPAYALEGSVFSAGCAVQWLRDELKLISSAAETEEIARSVTDTAGVYMVPAFSGLGAPYWNADARGIITGLTRGANRAHLVRAVLEAIAYQSAEVLALMEKETGIRLSALRVDGGASANGFLMQFQADLLGCPIERPRCLESTALGASLLGRAALNLPDLPEDSQTDRFLPQASESVRQALMEGWKAAVQRCL